MSENKKILSALERFKLGEISLEEYNQLTGQSNNKDPQKDPVHESFNQFQDKINKGISKNNTEENFEKFKKEHASEYEASKTTSPVERSANNNDPAKKSADADKPFVPHIQQLNEDSFKLSGASQYGDLEQMPVGKGGYLSRAMSFGSSAFGNARDIANKYLDKLTGKEDFGQAVASLGDKFRGMGEAAMASFTNTREAWCAHLASDVANKVSDAMYGKELMPHFAAVSQMRGYFDKKDAYSSVKEVMSSNNEDEIKSKIYPGAIIYFKRPGGEHVGVIGDREFRKNEKTGELDIYIAVNHGNYSDKAQSDTKMRKLEMTANGGYKLSGLNDIPVAGFGDTEKLVEQKFGNHIRMEQTRAEVAHHSAPLRQHHEYDLAEAPHQQKHNAKFIH